MMLENYHPKIVDKETFIKYYSNNTLRRFIDDMEEICETSKSLHILGYIPRMLKPKALSMHAQDLAQKGAAYMLNLPIGEKAKSILAKAADDLVQKKEPKEDYKNTFLVLEDLVNGYRGLFNEKYEKLFNEACEEIIIFKFLEESNFC